MTTKFSKHEIAEAKEYLLKVLKPGQTIYCSMKHVSRSGMYRVISLLVPVDEQITDISWAASKLLEGWDDRHYGCKASGCGMDMGFHLVYNLGCVLFGDGWECVGEQCPHNSHTNDYKAPRGKGVIHNNQYALRSSWL